MTTTKPPVLTDEEMEQIHEAAYQKASDSYPYDAFASVLRMQQSRDIEQAVLERAATTKPPVLTDDDRMNLWQPFRDFPVDWICQYARAIELLALERAGADAVRDPAPIPQGYALVPIKPTKEMLAAGRKGVSYTQAPWLAERYVAMLEAAPAIRALKGAPAAAVPAGYTDGGRNMFYEGTFEGETERERQSRLTWANDMRAAFERHTGNGWFDKDWHRETGLWAAAWRAANAPEPAAAVADDEDIIADIIANHAFHDIEHGKAAMDKWQMRDAAKDILAHFAPQAGQLSGNAGEVDRVVSGALFDFLGYLTARDERLCLSSHDEASPTVIALETWAEKRGLNLDEADVMGWPAAIAASKGAAS